jgi:hypothetical protein
MHPIMIKVISTWDLENKLFHIWNISKPSWQSMAIKKYKPKCVVLKKENFEEKTTLVKK